MAKKAAPKKASKKVTTLAETTHIHEARPLFKSFDEYAKANPDGAALKDKIGVDYFRNYLLFPIDPKMQPVHLPGGYLFASVYGFTPGMLKAEKPHHWTSVYDGSRSMRRWAFTEAEAIETMQEIAILLPKNLDDLKDMGFVQED